MALPVMEPFNLPPSFARIFLKTIASAILYFRLVLKQDLPCAASSRLFLPLSTPILATSAILTLVASWNNFFLPLIAFNNQNLYTLPMGIMYFQGQHASQWNLILAYLTLAMVPAVLMFIFGQKYIVAGLTGGALKG